ncbi:MAG: GTPase ObgE [Gammaproteobacteria bacterium]|nr:GTPase ObgE [Gammaproteobacteria bacterium]
MKFVDEVTIRVIAGNGGEGCCSFRREKHVPRGGPDGGDGGDGGSVYLAVNEGLNTLADFRHVRRFEAATGEAGKGQDRFGKDGLDLEIRVPTGTLVYDEDTGELMGDLVSAGQRLLVAKGGRHGLGNTHFKSSTNRAPRRTTKGERGEKRNLRLEMQLLADVGLLGMPNAGKSSLLRQISAARPKVADYPFTTLYPFLGVVRTGAEQSFVVADIPGLIEGAADGAGLGTHFLKHLARTRLLLQLVDVGTATSAEDVMDQIRVVQNELRLHDDRLQKRERWLVLNKTDLLPPDELHRRAKSIVRGLRWKQPLYVVSAATGAGCRELMLAVQQWIDRQATPAEMRNKEAS